jgi:hypothetical protein
MPESFPNQFTAQDDGDIVTSFLLLASDGAGGPVTADRVINWGVVAPFINGTETNTTTGAHGLGVVPIWIGLAGVWTDAGRFASFLRADIPADATNFFVFWTDINGVFHGPGNENPLFQWVAIG